MKSDQHIDAKLVIDFQSGKQEALALLVKRWHLTFCKKAFWLVKDADIAKDIAQDTWQTIIAKIDNLNDASSFGSWALRIVYSKSLDVLRRNSREAVKQQEYAKDQNYLVEEPLENTSLKTQLLQAIQDLPEQQKLVIKLFYLEAYSLIEISESLKISKGTAKSRLFYAREKLRLVLKEKKK